VKSKLPSEERKTTVVLGIPRGGMIIAEKVAKKLSPFYFDAIISKKLSYPGNEERAIGAISEDGFTYLDPQFARDSVISQAYLEREKLNQLQEIKRRTISYFEKHRNDIGPILKNKTAILVDDGAATGSTVIAAVNLIKRLEPGPKGVIVALPVAPKTTVNILERECEAQVVVLKEPDSARFYSVEQYYKNFEQISDDHVIQVMRNRLF
jgi:putative phosphoribosyl transferase